MKYLCFLFLTLWGLTLFFLLITTGAWHYAVFAPPRTPPSAAPNTLIHILSTECGCSRTVLNYLISRGALPQKQEQIWLFQATPEITQKLTSQGFIVSSKPADELITTSGIKGLPWLLIYDSTGHLAYSGGYASQPLRESGSFQDVSLAALVAQG